MGKVFSRQAMTLAAIDRPLHHSTIYRYESLGLAGPPVPYLVITGGRSAAWRLTMRPGIDADLTIRIKRRSCGELQRTPRSSVSATAACARLSAIHAVLAWRRRQIARQVRLDRDDDPRVVKIAPGNAYWPAHTGLRHRGGDLPLGQPGTRRLLYLPGQRSQSNRSGPSIVPLSHVSILAGAKTHTLLDDTLAGDTDMSALRGYFMATELL